LVGGWGTYRTEIRKKGEKEEKPTAGKGERLTVVRRETQYQYYPDTEKKGRTGKGGKGGTGTDPSTTSGGKEARGSRETRGPEKAA